MANIIESRVTLEDEVFEETIDTMEEPIEVVRPSSYNDLEDLPQVNGVTLMGNKTSEELGIVTATDIENAVSAEATLRENADTALGGRIDSEKTARENADTALGGRIDGEITNRTNADNALGTRIDNEILARQGGDNNLQTQIDAITSKSDVVDVVADYAALQAYDTQHLGNNDVIKVLDDETHNDAQTYYRWNKTAGTWSYIGSEAPYYSKGQIDQQMQAKQDKLTAGTGINLNGSTISADTTVLATKEDLEPEIVADLPTVGDATKLYLTPTNKTASGNPITIDLKEDVGQITSFRLDGDTYQQSYTGKNLYRVETCSQNGVTFTVNADGSLNIVGKATANVVIVNEVKPITLMADNSPYICWWDGADSLPTGVAIRLGIDKNGNWDHNLMSGMKGSTKSRTFTSSLGDGDAIRCELYVENGTEVNLQNIKIQLEAGSTPTTFEPYVGGVPSPNPDYPQPIQTVTGEQTVEIVGKNRLNPQEAVVGTIDANTGEIVPWSGNTNMAGQEYIEVEPNTEYTIRAGTQFYFLRISEYTSDKANITRTQIADNTSLTITTTPNTKYIRWSANYRSIAITNPPQLVTDTQMQIEKGAYSSYTPYSKQTLPISLGSIELCKLGTYQDYIWKDGDSWKVHKATATITLTGASSENWYIDQYAYMLNNVISAKSFSDIANMEAYCRSFSKSATGQTSSYAVSFWYNATGTGVRFIKDQTPDLSSFRNWLASNNQTVYYPLATSTDTTITDTTLIAQLEAVRKASLQNGTNNITNTAMGANLAGSMSIGYYGYNPSEYSEWLYVDDAWEQVGGRPIPTKTSELVNDSKYVTRDDIAPKLQTLVVDELPAVGEEGKLYLTPKNYTRGTATGNPIAISLDEDAGQITSFQLDGDTYQQSYTGKNLCGGTLDQLKNRNPSGTWNGNQYFQSGITWTVYENADGTIDRIEASGQATENGKTFYIKSFDRQQFEEQLGSEDTYTLSGCPQGGSSGYYVRVASIPWKAMLTDRGSAATGTLVPADNYSSVHVILGVDTSAGQVNNLVFRPQLELGSTATSFEPYVGGQASPNPDYPQPIQTVTGEQTVTVSGKNKLRQIDGTYSRNGITATVNNGKITLNGTATATVYLPLAASSSDYYSLYLSGAYTLSATSITGVSYTIYHGAASVLYSTSSSQTKTLNGTYENVRFQINVAQGTTLNNVVVEAQLEAGSTATAYEPYSSNDYEINLGKNLFNQNDVVNGIPSQTDGSIVSTSGAGRTSDYIPVMPNTVYSHTGHPLGWATIAWYKADKSFIVRVDNITTTTSPSGAAYARVSCAQSNLGTCQFEAGEPTDYAPYFTPIELCKLGTYQDYIYKDGDDWKVHKDFGKANTSDAVDMTRTQTAGSEKFRYIFGMPTGTPAPKVVTAAEVQNVFGGYCSGLRAGTRGAAYAGTNNVIGPTDGNFYRFAVFYVEEISSYSTEQALAWLKEKAFDIVYELETPTDTVITDTALIAQLEAIRTASLQASNTITNTATGSNLAGDMEIGYYGYNPTNRYDKWLWLDINNNYEQIGS